MYTPPWFLFNKHLETICPSLFRSVHTDYERERIDTPDHDFLDLDWLKRGSKRLIILSHGLEGNSHRAYVKGMARAFAHRGFDALAWNYRGCGEEMNKTLRFYHSGATDDLHLVVNHALEKGYQQMVLLGFSLGGNLTLKYAGERTLYDEIKCVVAFSVPLDLYTSSVQISRPSNWIYSRRFLKSLKKKIRAKAKVMEGIDTRGLDLVSGLEEFDDRYTGPLHGFANAREYYARCSAINFLHAIQAPTLIVNAKNDPFLSPECYPANLGNALVNLETPDRGGHVGFTQINRNGLYWSEQRALEFARTLIPW